VMEMDRRFVDPDLPRSVVRQNFLEPNDTSEPRSRTVERVLGPPRQPRKFPRNSEPSTDEILGWTVPLVFKDRPDSPNGSLPHTGFRSGLLRNLYCCVINYLYHRKKTGGIKEILRGGRCTCKESEFPNLLFVSLHLSQPVLNTP
jgi:hypothetical protein